MGASNWAAWTVAVAASLLLTLNAWQGPTPAPSPGTPPPLPRPANSAEINEVRDVARQLEVRIGSAARSLGHGMGVDELEATRPDGTPVLPGGIPDNPLVPGVGTVRVVCPASESNDGAADWTWCPDDGAVRAVIP